MNILVIGKFSADQFGFHISDTLRDMGHNTLEFDPAVKYKYSKTTIGRRAHQINHIISSNLSGTAFFRDRRKKKLNKLFDKCKIDLTISTYDFLYPDEVDFIKARTKAPIVMWFPDGIGTASKAFFMIADFDFIFFQDPYAVITLKNQYNKTNVLYLPECCNPKFHKKLNLSLIEIEKYKCDISTYGNPHNYRAYFFSQLVDLNYSIKIWGHQPPVWQNNHQLSSLFKGEYLINEEKAKSVIAAKINLNTLVPAGVYSLNARAFEIAGIGGFQLIQYRAALSNIFEDGSELVSFKNFEDLLEKIKYFINNDELRNKIADAGQKRAYSEHTYLHRINLILETVFGRAKGFDIPQIDLKMI